MIRASGNEFYHQEAVGELREEAGAEDRRLPVGKPYQWLCRNLESRAGQVTLDK